MGVRRPEWVLAAAVLVSSPMIPGLLDGGIAVSTVLLRFLGALVLCWVGGWALTLVIERYAESARRAEIVSTIEAAIQQRANANAAPSGDPSIGPPHGGPAGPGGAPGGELGPGRAG